MKNLKVLFVFALILVLGAYQNSVAQSETIQNNKDNQRAATGYIKIGDIKGESTDAKHKDWINLLSFSNVNPSPSTGQAAAFMKIEGIAGESNDKNHKGWHALAVFVFEPNEVAATARTKGETTLGDVVVVKSMDKSTPLLANLTQNNQPIPRVKIVKYDNNDNRQEYYVIKLKDVLVSSYQTGGSSGDVVPVDQISLNFSKIEVEYVKQDKAGQETSETLYQSQTERVNKKR